MNTVLNSYGQLYGCPEILKKSYKFFCRGLDIRVAEIMKRLLMEENAAVLLSVSFQARDVAAMFFAGGGMAVIAVCISLLPILRANPKDTLAKMEG